VIGDDYAAEYKLMLTEAGLTLRNWIVWHYTFGPHQERKFGRDHCHILYFTRHRERFTFNADAIRVRSARQDQGDKRANPAGRVPGDVWSFPRMPGNAHERLGHPCQMPEVILERIVLAASSIGDLVFDPFAGSGTTLAVAKLIRRRLSRVGEPT
jgi:DNA modification methylase